MSDDAPVVVEEQKAVTVIVASKMKRVLRDRGMRTDGQLMDAVNARVVLMLEQAAEHAKAEGRATVRPHDLAA